VDFIGIRDKATILVTQRVKGGIGDCFP